jgi:hypothetical protein
MHPTLREYNELGFLAVGQDQPQKLHCGVTHGALEVEEEDYSEKQCKQCKQRSFKLKLTICLLKMKENPERDHSFVKISLYYRIHY